MDEGVMEQTERWTYEEITLVAETKKYDDHPNLITFVSFKPANKIVLKPFICTITHPCFHFKYCMGFFQKTSNSFLKRPFLMFQNCT